MYKSKKWLMPNIDICEALRISEDMNISPLTAKILCARGFDYESAKAFLTTSSDNFYDPFLLSGMENAVKRINTALAQKEKIAVYGDYDVDGITATYILYDYLKTKGADVIYYIPNREDEGYGMNCNAIDTLHSNGVSLITTVDVGITAVTEVDYAKKLGIDTIVTDHHELKDALPDAVAVINPKITDNGYPFDSLAGVGVALKLIYAHSGCSNNVLMKYCDIAAIGTVADMVPLRDENRYIASTGVKLLRQTSNVGLKAIMTVAGIKKEEISSADISFAIAPRLNAAGRMSCARLSVELLMENDDKKALLLAEKLDTYNRNRQKEEQHIFDECIRIIERDDLGKKDFILVAKENWAHGIIGIVSSKITELYYKPSAVVSINPDGTGKASGRSIKGINLFETLSACSDSLIKYGGHELAAGFTVKADALEAFERQLNNYVSDIITEDISTPFIEIDSKLALQDISLDSVQALTILEPYGIENRAPMFCVNDVRIESIRYTQSKKHAFIVVSKDEIRQEFPAFSMAERIADFSVGDCICVAGTLGVNTFRGNTRAQFIIRDIKHMDKCPFISRDELKDIFCHIKCRLSSGNYPIKNTDTINLKHRLQLKADGFKISTALKIFDELQILSVEDHTWGHVVSKGKNYDTKTELKNSKTFRKYSA